MLKRRFVIATLGAVAGSLAFGASAQAFDVSGTIGEPANKRAGANSDLTIQIEVQEPEAQIRDLTIHLPPGLVGDPTGPLQCAETELLADACPDGSQVGTTSSDVDVVVLDPVITVPLTVTGDVYNMVPQQGEPARFGIVLRPPSSDVLPLLPKIYLQSPASLRQGDFGLDSILKDLPNQSAGLETRIKSFDLTLFAKAGNDTDFLRNPTSCTPKQITFDAKSYDDQTASGEAPPFTPTNCPALDFSPELTAEVEGVGTGIHPELTTVISQGATEAGLKDAEVILPAELQPNNDALNNQCTIPDFNAGTCAAAAAIGSAVASSPLQSNPLTGTAYLLNNGGGLGLGLDLQGDLAFKLIGSFVFDPQFRTGNLFEDLPDIPISEFELTIDGGDGGLVTATRDLCEPPAILTDYDFLGHNGEQVTGQVETGVTGCPEVDPTATVDVPNPGADNPDLDLDVTAGSDPVKKVKLKLPGAFRFTSGKKFKAGATVLVDGAEVPDSHVKGKPHRAILDDLGAADTANLEIRKKAMARVKKAPTGPFVVKIVEEDGDKFTVPDA